MPYSPPPPPPPPAKEANLPKPIGVPEDYAARRPLDPRFSGGLADTGNILAGGSGRTSAEMAVPPRYFSGMEFSPANLGPERISQLQRLLVGVGLIGPKTEFRLGVWDDTSRNAYRNLLELANTYGIDEAEAMDMLASSPEVNGAGGTGLPRTELANPDDLRQIAETVSAATVGRRADAAFVDRFIAAFHQAQQQEAAEAAAGGTYVGAPSAETLAEEMVRNYDPAGAAEMDLVGRHNAFFDLLDATAGR